MCGGPDVPPPSEAERFQAERAARRLQEWETDGYKDLEKQGIERAQDDYSGMMKSRATADLNSALAEGDTQAALSVGQGNFADVTADYGRSYTSGITQAHSDAVMDAMTQKDTRSMGMAKVGQDVSLTLDHAATSAASRSLELQKQAMRSKMIRDRGRTQALLNVAQGAVARHMGPKSDPNSVGNSTGSGTPGGSYAPGGLSVGAYNNYLVN